MKNEGTILAQAVVAATTKTSNITRHVVRAEHGTVTARRASLSIAISEARQLLDALEIAELRLGWKKKEDAA